MADNLKRQSIDVGVQATPVPSQYHPQPDSPLEPPHEHSERGVDPLSDAALSDAEMEERRDLEERRDQVGEMSREVSFAPETSNGADGGRSPQGKQRKKKGEKKVPFAGGRPLNKVKGKMNSVSNFFAMSTTNIGESMRDVRRRLQESDIKRTGRVVLTLGLASVFFFVLLLWSEQSPLDGSLHSASMFGYPDTLNGLRAVTAGQPYTLNLSAHKAYQTLDVIFAGSRAPNTTYLTIGFYAADLSGNAALVKQAVVQLSPTEEIEYDKIWSKMEDRAKSALGSKPSAIYFKVTTETPQPVAFMLNYRQLGPVGEFRPLIAGIILGATYIVMAMDMLSRMLVAIIGSFVGLSALVALHGSKSIQVVVSGIDFNTLGLLFGFMILINILAQTGGLDRLAFYCVKASGGRPFPLLVLLGLATLVVSAFVPNAAAALVMVPTAITICEMLNLRVEPYVIVLACFANMGGCCLAFSDFPNLLITNGIAGVAFVDWITYVLPGVLWAVPFVVLTLWVTVRKELVNVRQAPVPDSAAELGLASSSGPLPSPTPPNKVDLAMLDRKCQIRKKELLIKASIATAAVMILIFLTPVHHKDIAWIAVIGSMLILAVTQQKNVPKIVEQTDWETLFYLAGLFVLVNVTVELKLIRLIGQGLQKQMEDAPAATRDLNAVSLMLLVSAAVSMVLDNTAFTLVMVKVLNVMVAGGVPVSPKMLAWCLSYGANLGGNATLVGAAANVVSAGIAAQRGHKIPMVRYSKVSFPFMLVSVLATYVYALMAFVGGKHHG